MQQRLRVVREVGGAERGGGHMLPLVGQASLGFCAPETEAMVMMRRRERRWWLDRERRKWRLHGAPVRMRGVPR
jgi:hypothetical protein